DMPEQTSEAPDPIPPWVADFLRHLEAERGASVYTQRNYRQALLEFCEWHEKERGGAPGWTALGRDDFRAYLRFLGRGKLGRAAVLLRFSAFRSFYKFLARQGRVEGTPIRNISVPKLAKRLPRFLTVEQLSALLRAPMQELESRRQNTEREVDESQYHRD